MQTIEKEMPKKMDLDLRGPEGNAFELFYQARELSIAYDLDYNTIIAEMMSGHYENLISVFTKYFGEYVNLIR